MLARYSTGNVGWDGLTGGRDAMSADYHLREIERELEGAERAYAGMERQMDKLIYENRALQQQIEELKLEIVRLGGKP